MEVKIVPWWRKALNFALSGIRSGFGLFSRSQKSEVPIEPENVAGHEQIREEEAELTEHSPKQNSIAKVADEVEAVSANEANASAELATEAPGEATPASAPETEADEKTAAEPDAAPAQAAATVQVIDPPGAELKNETEAAAEAGEEAEALTDVAPAAEVAPDEAAAEVAAEPDNASLEIAATLDGDTEDEQPEIAAEPESVIEIEAPVEAESNSEPVAEPVAEAVDTSVAKSEVAPGSEASAESEAETATEVEEVFPVEETHESEAALAVEAVTEPEAGEIEVAEDLATVEDAAPLNEALEPDAPTSPVMPELAPSDEPVHEEGAAEAEPILTQREELMAPVTEAAPGQVTEQPGAVENESVDEAIPLAQAAISEDSAPESASPASDEAVETTTEQAADQIADRTVDQAIDQPMDWNRPNSELTAEQDQAEETASAPVTESEATVPAPEARAEEAAAASEAIADAPEESPAAASEPEVESIQQPEAPAAAASEEPSAGAAETPAEVEAAVAASEQPAQDLPAAPAAQPETAAATAREATPAHHPSKPFIKLEAREGQADASPFSVIVSQVYDGPLDLLLDLIRKQDIDIYDIPIARITSQFLAYVNQLKASDVDVAGEFIYTASLLIHIKSKMLLPRAPAGPDDAAEDPRRELVERLLEHERFKNAAQMLQQKQMLEAATWTNPGVREFQDDAAAEPEIAADTVDLVRVFRDILERARNRPVINVQEDSVTVGQMIQFLSRRLVMEDKPVALRRLLSHTRSERALIAMFLALLELVRLQAILLRQDRAFSEIFIKKHSNFEGVMTEAQARDDWN